MNKDNALKQIEDKDFLDKMYHFSYHRCNSSHEAEDLCADIILTIITAVNRQEEIDNFNAFAWTIAHRVYADFCEKRKKYLAVSMDDFGENSFSLAARKNEIDNLISEMTEAEELQRIFNEIAFLSKAYRDVMVMYYVDEVKPRNIAQKLSISETTVRQRLFAARSMIRKEIETMDNRKLSLKPIYMRLLGTGDPVGNDPRVKAERTLSKNLIYLCRKKPKSAKELSEELCVPMPYIEEELEIQCRGENGKYGLLRRLGSGKYITNILLADHEEYVMANKIYEKYITEICNILKSAVEQEEDRILSFPYLSPQKDVRFIMWAMIWKIIEEIVDRVNQVIADRFFSDIVPSKREFSCVAVASCREEIRQGLAIDSVEGIYAMDIAGYREAHFVNIFGKRIEPHFYCGHNISRDESLLMTLKAIGGLNIDELAEDEKEIAAKAIACGYLRRDGNKIVPKMVAIEKKNAEELLILARSLIKNMQGVIDAIAKEMAVFMKKHIPAHLINEYQLYQIIAITPLYSQLIEECISQGVLKEPEGQGGAEGVLMIVEK